jgi:D-alanyl-D-alanine carboxypeptidase
MSQPDNMRNRRLQDLVDGVAAKKHIQHAVLVVESMDGSFHWSGAAGQAVPDGAPMTADTPFYIASIDKLWVATVVLQLHEEGALSIDDPVTEHLAPALIGGIHRLHGIDFTGHISIRNLLGHTSGLADYLEDAPRRGVNRGTSLVERLFEGDDRDLTFEDMLRVVRDDLRPHFPPQPVQAAKQQVRYSDTNFQLLGMIIEAVAGRPLHEVMAERVFRRLQLQHTWYAGYSEPVEPVAAPAMLWVADKPLHRPRLLRSLNSIYTTPAELIGFLRALVRGELFADPGTLGLMQGRWNRFGFPRDKAALRAPGWPIEYALGIKRFRLPRPFTPLAAMPPIIGHTGSTGTWLFYCAELDLFMAGAVNQATAGAVPYRLLPKVLKVLRDDA